MTLRTLCTMLWWLPFLFFLRPVQAQVNAASLQNALDKELKRGDLVYPLQVKQFYELFQNKTAWIDNQPALENLWQNLDTASHLGLQQKDYQYNFITRFRSGAVPLRTFEDSVMADFRFTDAAIHFFRDVKVGNYMPTIGYNGLQYTTDWTAIPSFLTTALRSGRLKDLLAWTEMQTAEYIALKGQIILHNKMLNDTAFKMRPAVTSAKTLAQRVAALNRAINTLRWLHTAMQSNEYIIVVNIPSASLLVFDRKGVTLESKVIVGKPSSRTPTLSSRIEDVILYPYWTVPKRIAVKELLPRIKKNRSYLDANGFDVVDQRGKVVNPYTIDWQSLNAGDFPYTLRQSTGCDNSLGIVKLNFYNPYTVYLHDTPEKSLFGSNKRFYSHGCIRVEKAIELARLLLRDRSPIMDSLIDKGCLPDQDPIVLPAEEKMPVFVLYNTAWVDAAANVQFYADIYARFSAGRQ